MKKEESRELSKDTPKKNLNEESQIIDLELEMKKEQLKKKSKNETKMDLSSI